jgi:hypothetical protein
MDLETFILDVLQHDPNQARYTTRVGSGLFDTVFAALSTVLEEETPSCGTDLPSLRCMRLDFFMRANAC